MFHVRVFQLGLGSILFAMTVDCLELNETAAVESVSPRQSSEIIIAVPSVSTSERKSVSSKRAAIISFEEDENKSSVNNNVSKSSTPPTAVSLADACLKYQEKQKLTDDQPKPFVSDSAYERLHAEPINVGALLSHPNETDFIEPESPTAITIINPVTQTYPSLSNSYECKETDSSMSKATDSSSITSNTTTNSSSSPPHQAITSQQSPSTSMSSSICSVHNSPDTSNIPNMMVSESPELTEFTSRLQELTTAETENILRIQELEKRCACLEERVTALSL